MEYEAQGRDTIFKIFLLNYFPPFRPSVLSSISNCSLLIGPLCANRLHELTTVLNELSGDLGV